MSATAKSAIRQLFGKRILLDSNKGRNFTTLLNASRQLSTVQEASSKKFAASTIPCTNNVRFLMLSAPRFVEGTSESFKQAVKDLNSVKDADNQTKLKIYALFKQATVGKNNAKKPGMLDLVGKAKWEAWNALGDMSKQDAEKEYIDIVNGLLGQASKKAETTSAEKDGLLITTQNGIRTIKLNRPDKKNALNLEMYQTIKNTLKESNEDDSVNIVVLTGAGDFFCSGNDLGNFMNVTDPIAMAKEGRYILQDYVASYIDLKKPLVAVVNGPAVGIAVTVLGLCDAVFATDRATFTTPFSSLGQSPEGCSSYIFPRVMGYAKASELLYFNQKFTAKQAEECGLVTKVFPEDRFQAEVWKRIDAMAELPVKSLIYSKDLVRGRERELLHNVNKVECERLEERWTSEDCMNAIMKFFSQKAKM